MREAGILSFFRSATFWALIAAGVVFGVFFRSIRYDFSPWDDEPNIVYNASYQAPLTAETLASFWQRDYHSQYMPVTWSAWALCAEANRKSYVRPALQESVPFAPTAFHLLALGAHGINVLLVFALLRRFVPGGTPLPAFAGALLFGLHPIQTEAAAWINGGNITFAYLWGFAALLLWDIAMQSKQRHHRLLLLGAATFFYALALLAKPTAVTILLMALVISLAIRRLPWRAIVIPAVGWLILAIGIVVVNAQGKSVLPLGQSPPLLRPLVAGDALAFYLGKLLLPVKLACSYARTPRRIFAAGYGYFMWCVPALIAACWMFLKRNNVVPRSFRSVGDAAGWLFVAGTVPTMGLVPFYFQYHSTVADRYLYPALLAPAYLLTWLLSREQVRRYQTVVYAGVFALMTLLAAKSYQQTTTWKSGVSLFGNATLVAPSSPDMHFNLAREYARVARVRDAVREYQTTIKYDPKYIAAYTNLGVLWMQNGQPDLGAKAHEAALRLLPSQPQSNYWLGVYHADRKEWQSAALYYRAALQGMPGDSNMQTRLRQAEALSH